MISRRLAFTLVLLALAAGAIAGGIVGVFAYIDIVGGAGEPSAPISAPTLSLAILLTPSLVPSDIEKNEAAVLSTEIAGVASQVDELSQVLVTERAMIGTEFAGLQARIYALTIQRTTVAGLNLQTSTPSRTPLPTRTPTPTLTPSLTYTPSPTPLPNQVLFRIVPEESEVRFTLFEDAGPDPGRLTIVGRTNQVAGDIIVDFDHPSNSRLGTIRVNIRSLRTQYEGQGQAMRGEILLSAQPEYEFSDFLPTMLVGLPESVEIGEPVHFQIIGDFPLRGVTRTLTFDATITPVSQTELRGYATTLIRRQDYGLMQSALADHLVSEEITLEIEFTARAVEQ